MFVERGAIDPEFIYMDEARIKHVLGIGIFQASSFRSAGLNHRRHIWPVAALHLERRRWHHDPLRRQKVNAPRNAGHVLFSPSSLRLSRVRVSCKYGLRQLAQEKIMIRILRSNIVVIPVAMFALTITASAQQDDSVKPAGETGNSAGVSVTTQVTAAGAADVTTTGGLTHRVPFFTGSSTIGNSIIYATPTGVGFNRAPSTGLLLDVGGAATVRGALTLVNTGNATTSAGVHSYPLRFYASTYSGTTNAPISPNLQLQAEPVGNNTARPAASLHLLYDNGSALVETGFYLNPDGTIHFASGQTFPGLTGPVGPAGPAGPVGATGAAGPAGLLMLPFAASAATPGTADAGGPDDPNPPALLSITNTAMSDAAIFGMGGPAGTITSGTVTTYYSGGTGVVGQGGVAHVTNAAEGLSSPGGDGVIGMGGAAIEPGERGGEGGYFSGGLPAVDGAIGGLGILVVPGYPSTQAALLEGDVFVDGNLTNPSETLTIDDPADPANKYLSHSVVESPDMMNVYNGNVTTDGSGTAVVTMPEWFELLNRDFRYQLTPLGQFAQAMIAVKIGNGTFTIRTDKPNVEVSWQVTGIRQDAWANAHRVPVEEEKPEQDLGKFLHPELFGRPGDASITESHHPELRRAKRTTAATTAQE
jgi:hypothetical protein